MRDAGCRDQPPPKPESPSKPKACAGQAGGQRGGDPRPSTLNPQPSILNPNSQTLDPKPSNRTGVCAQDKLVVMAAATGGSRAKAKCHSSAITCAAYNCDNSFQTLITVDPKP